MKKQMTPSRLTERRFDMRRFGGVVLVRLGILIVGSALLSNRGVFAEEPVKRFLTRLQEEGLYDIGLKYLDQLSAKGRLPQSLSEDYALERNLLLQESLKSVRSQTIREERTAQVEKGYKEFLAKFPSHARRSEAQTRLGDLLLERSQIALNESKKEGSKEAIEKNRAKARDGYLEALDLYTKTTEELRPILESMKGDKIKANDVEGKERREKYQAEYRQAQILQAKMMEFISQTFEPQSADWRQWLQKSETALTQIIEKTSGTEAPRRMLCLLYRGEVQRQLGKLEEARDSLSHVADQDGTGIFRTWRAQANAALVRLDANEKAQKHEAAILRGEEVLKNATTSDKNESEWIDLQLAVAEARIAYGKILDDKKEENKARNNRKAARDSLQNIVKKQASRDPAIQELVRKARECLGSLGIETPDKQEDSKLPEVRNFADAIKAGRERLDRAESAEATVPILEQQLTNADEKQRIQEQIKALREDVLKDRKSAIELYLKSLKLFREKDSRDDLIEARYLLSYLFLRTEQYWESAAVAQDLLVTARGTERAEKSAGFARHALNKLLLDAPMDRQLAFAAPIEQLARKLQQYSPDSEQAQEAVELLVKLALVHKQYERAEQYVAMGKGKGGGGASILGMILWDEYRQRMRQHRLDKSDETEADRDLKSRAERLLKSSWDSLEPAKTDKNMIAGTNALAALYLSNDQIDQALGVLNDPNKGAVKLIETAPDVDAKTKLDAGRTLLQALVQAAGRGERELVASEVAAIVQKMKQLSGSDDKLLANSLSNLAFELQTKLQATKDIEQQSKLGTAFGLLIRQLVSVSDDVATLDSAGTSIFILASNMLKVPSMANNAKQLMTIAEEAFSKIASKPKDEFIAAKRNVEEFQLKLGRSKSIAGKYEEANKIFGEILAKNPNISSIQIEAARNFEKWANGSNVELLKKAIYGAQPDAKKINQIWGWAQIAAVAARRMNDPKYQEIFFEARMSIARCRRAIALTQSGAERTQSLEQAMKEMRQTYLTYPNLGGPELESEFSKLLKELQTDLGKPPVGLNQFKEQK